MILDLNWVDLAIIGVMLFFALESLSRPFILEFLDLVSFLLAFFISFSFYNFPARFFESQFLIPHGLSLVLGFMSIWFMSEIIFFLLVRILLPKLPKLPLPAILSIVPSFFRGLIFIALFLVITATFPIQPAVKRAVLDSELGSRILKNAYSLEQPVKNVFGGVANDTLTFLTIRPKTNERVDLGFQAEKISGDELSENTMVSLVNKERVALGLKALEVDGKLRSIARSYSQDMLKRGYFSHYSPEGETVADRALAQEIDFLVIGENLAYAPTVESAHKGLMNSEGHRANILSTDYHRIGIGIIDGGVYGKMFTQVFSN